VKILVASDKFKGSLSAREAGSAMRRGLLRVWPDASIEVLPVADGGDGTAAALVDALGGSFVAREVRGPDGKPVRASFGSLGDGSSAVVELAGASGLALLAPGTNDPRTATTYGTGELIGAAVTEGARRILLAIGGSATNDGGAGALPALGVRFLDRDGAELPSGGAALASLARIDVSGIAPELRKASIDIACDVDNPLTGPRGASAIYGPQKGASPEVVRELDRALGRYADALVEVSGVDVRDVPGAGAAGGIGAGFMALLGARLVAGAALVLDAVGFETHLDGVSLVVTGEGRLDRQTLAGKAPFAVAQAARRHGVACAAVAGSVDLRGDDMDAMGIADTEAVAPEAMALAEAVTRASELTADAAERLGKRLAVRLFPGGTKA
jgi:glycerate kinase